MSLILIVEDNEKNMKLVRDILQAKGHSTLEAVTGEEGVKLAQDRKPDLVLMDIQLPGMNGIEALKVLRANATTQQIPIVAITASVMQQDKQHVMDAGFDGFIEKPINLKEFLATVQGALGPRPAA
jgi:two-component system, cell cycle response regulator DivK